MSNYKAETTLNEKDSLQDMLNVEKETVKMYSTALTEGVSKGFRQTVEKLFSDAADSQFKVYMLMTELGYAKVTSAPESALIEEKAKFSKVVNTLN